MFDAGDLSLELLLLRRTTQIAGLTVADAAALLTVLVQGQPPP
ncbi:hypothetical protein ACFWSF_38210 [Streptomyces sp. NPDC058611]